VNKLLAGCIFHITCFCHYLEECLTEPDVLKVS